MTIYALADAADDARTPVYVGRTVRPLSARLRSHRSARNARWLRECNRELAVWLADNVPVAVPLEEVPADGNEWAAERSWIEKFAYSGPLLNKAGNPLRPPIRRGGLKPPLCTTGVV